MRYVINIVIPAAACNEYILKYILSIYKSIKDTICQNCYNTNNFTETHKPLFYMYTWELLYGKNI